MFTNIHIYIYIYYIYIYSISIWNDLVVDVFDPIWFHLAPVRVFPSLEVSGLWISI